MENEEKTIVLYSTGCPLCRALKLMLDNKHVSYSVESDVEAMKEKGFSSVPVLEVDGKAMMYGEALKYIREKL